MNADVEVTSDQIKIPFAHAVRPRFSSALQGNAFEMIVWQVRANLLCGIDHAWASARNLAGASHDPEDVMRCALADFQAAKLERNYT